MWRIAFSLTLFFCCLPSVFGFTYIPELEPVHAVQGHPKQLNDHFQMGFDDRGQLCIAAHEKGLLCYDGTILTKLHDFSDGLVSVNSHGKQQLIFADLYRVYSLSDGKSKVLLDPSDFKFNKNEYIESLFPFHGKDLDTKFFVLTSESVYIYANDALKKVVTLSVGDVAYFVRNDPLSSNIEVGTHKGFKIYNSLGELIEVKLRDVKVSYSIDDYYFTNKGIYLNKDLLMSGNFYSAFKLSSNKIVAVGNKGICAIDYDKAICPEFSDDIVKSVYVDKFQNIWAITNNGIKKTTLSHFQHIDTRYGLSNNQVRAIEANGNTLFVGTLKGVNTYNTFTKKLAIIKSTEHMEVRALLRVKDTLYIATLNKGLWSLNLKTDMLRLIDKSTTGRTVSLVLHEDQLWVATLYDGINIYSLNGEIVDRGLHPAIKQIRSLNVCNGEVLIASKTKGLIKLDDNKSLLFEGDRKAYLMACHKNELVAANNDEVFKVADNLSATRGHEVTSPIASLFYYKNTLWQLQENGLKKFSDASPITSNNYLPYLYLGIRLVHGRYLYAGSTKGLIAINLDDYQKNKNNTPLPRLVVSSSTSNGALVLKPRSNNHALTKQIGIYYQTEGYSAKMLHRGQELVFPLVSHNHNYGDKKLTFFLSHDGKNKIDSKTVTWQVSPPFWLTWWAYCLYIAIIGLMSSTILWFRLKANKKVSIANQALATSAQRHCEELLELNSKLTRASRSKSEFIAKVSHELRTPLTGIHGMLEIMQDTRLSDLQKAYLDAGIQCSYNLSAMIDDILEVSKIEFNKITINNLAFEFEPVFRLALLPLTQKAKQRHLFFKLDMIIPESLINMYCVSDPMKLQQIVVNLVGNAIKFTPSGAITVKLEVIASDRDDSSGKLHIMVKDTGIGIPYDKRELIFEQFEQIDNASSRHFEGAGLGLAIIKSFTDKMGGELRLQSAEGQGSCFDVLIPITFKAKQQVLASQCFIPHIDKKPITAQENIEYKILLVDDNYFNREVGKVLLEFLNIDVTLAYGGEEAIEQFEENTFDVIFLDLHMPDIDGFSTAEAIRDIEQIQQHKKHTPIIALTADKTPHAWKRCLDVGIDDILVKPYSKNQLHEKLQIWSNTKAFVDNLKGDSPEDI